MSAEEFSLEGEAMRMMIAMQLLEGLDLDQIISTVSYADAIGPFIDPTAYQQMLYRKGNMHDVAAVAEALRKPVEVYREKIKPLMPVTE